MASCALAPICSGLDSCSGRGPAIPVVIQASIKQWALPDLDGGGGQLAHVYVQDSGCFVANRSRSDRFYRRYQADASTVSTGMLAAFIADIRAQIGLRSEIPVIGPIWESGATRTAPADVAGCTCHMFRFVPKPHRTAFR